MSTLDAVHQLEAELNSEIFERKREIHGAIVALLARKHCLFVGPPGVAKSWLVRRLVDRIEFDDDEAFFQWLLTRYTTPEEVFGPPSLSGLREDRHRRNTEGKMSRSRVSFLDEYRRANSSILNSLLTIMNERLFFNDGSHIEVDLDTVFSGTNNFEPDDDLHAIDDRFLLRYEVRELQENGSVMAMLMQDVPAHPAKLLTYAQLQEAQRQVAQIEVPTEVVETILSLRDNLRTLGIEPSDRRFRESMAVIRAEAWFNGHERAEIEDLRILRSVMWSRLDEQKVVERAVLELANPLDREAFELLERVQSLKNELRKAIKEGDNPKAIAKSSVEIHAKLHRSKQKMDDIAKKFAEANRQSEVLDALDKEFVAAAKMLMNEGFAIPGGTSG